MYFAKILLIFSFLIILACSKNKDDEQPVIEDNYEKIISNEGRLIEIKNFNSSYLSTSRSLRVYLPASYSTSETQEYPVVYMQDGQNIITPGGTYGCWYVENALNSLVADNIINEVIIVGIDNTANRTSEYNYGSFYDVNGNNTTGNIENYAKFVTKEVIPYINRNYRTKTGPENTAIMGSSYGGMASLYFAWYNPDIFGMAACFSSTLRYENPNEKKWYDSPLFEAIKNDTSNKKNIKFWLFAGDREKIDENSNGMYNYSEWTYELSNLLISKGWKNEEDFLFEIGKNGLHNEATWAEYVNKPLQFFFGKNKDFSISKLEVRMSAEEMDSQKTIENSYILAKVFYNNGLSAEVPPSLLNVSSEDSDLFNLENGILTLKDDITKDDLPKNINLNINYKNVSSNVSIAVSETISKEIEVTFSIITPDNSKETIYLIGNFCNWKFDNALLLNLSKTEDGKNYYTGVFTFEKGQILNFKFCSGNSWAYEELKADGNPPSNRVLDLNESNLYDSVVDLWKAVP